MVKFTASDNFTHSRWRPQLATAMLIDMAATRSRRFRRTYIREWRKFRDMTLEQLAAAIDMTASHLSMLERGQRSYTQETLENLAKALKTDASALLSRNPSISDEIWPIWDSAKPEERQQIIAVAKALTGRAR